MAIPPYPILNDILNTARVRLNDAIASLAGDVVTNAQPFTQVMANDAWQRLQTFLANLGIVRLKQEIIIPNIPAVTSIDPASQVSLSWAGYFNGTTLLPAPVLPQDLIIPLKIWERVSGQNACFQKPMENMMDGLPSWPKQAANVVWEWRQDAIFMPGSQMIEDLRIRYASFLPNFATVGPVQWFNQPVPIMRCEDSLSWYICSEAANARGDMDGAGFDAKAEAAAKLIMNRDIQMKQRVNVRRKPRSGRFEQYEWGYGTGFV